MVMRLLEARRRGGAFRYRIWLDTTKSRPQPDLPDGTPAPPLPDPAYVTDETFETEDRVATGGESAAAFQARLDAVETVFRNLARYHAARTLAERNEAALAGEGNDLP